MGNNTNKCVFKLPCSCKDTKMHILNANFICVKTFLQSFLGQNNSFWFRITKTEWNDDLIFFVSN